MPYYLRLGWFKTLCSPAINPISIPKVIVCYKTLIKHVFNCYECFVSNAKEAFKRQLNFTMQLKCLLDPTVHYLVLVSKLKKNSLVRIHISQG